MILVIDNYDSFVHNLARYVRRLGQATVVVRNDLTTPNEIRKLDPQAIVLSPGPCRPQQAGCCLEVVRELHRHTPILGVCLGHQVIAEALGGRVVRAREAVHGQASPVWHGQRGIFAGIPDPLLAGRYHSLVVDPHSLPACLETTATLEDGTIMAVQHREFPVVGWQFHPESVLTECGYELLTAFLRIAAIDVSTSVPSGENRDARLGIAAGDWFRQEIALP